MQRVFREVLEDDALQISPNDTDETLPAWDSFAQVKLIIGLEEEFDIKFTIDEVAETKSVNGLYGLIVSKKAA
ncbi:MAG TPA: acyl carrier protein [Bryobacteraceae bacterium]|jgi:acyl carrier protein|nr:acyl carrier protein [Bryobacteraceae bacterium]